jgi:large subunit ribosomal protein L10
LAVSKEKKQQMVSDYVDKMSHSQAMILADYRGLTVAALTDLRRQLREVDGAFQIVKNTLFERALEEIGIPAPAEPLEGPLAVSYCLGEVPPIAKVLVDLAATTEVLQIKGAIVGTSYLDAEGVKGLATLPPREILLAQLLGSVQGPMSSLVSTITAPLRELVQVLKARAEQGQEAAA